LIQKKGSTFSASIFLAATTIGIGFLGIPVITGVAGFWPAILMNFLAWLYLTTCALLYMEAILLMPDGANVFSVSRRFLGFTGALLGFVAFILINVPYLASYFGMGHTVLSKLTVQFFGVAILPGISCILILLLMGGIVFLGVYVTDRFLLFLSAASLIAFISILVLGKENVEMPNLIVRDWFYGLFSFVILTSTLGSSAVLPTLASHVGRDPRKCRRVIWIGMAIPLVIVVIWQWVTIGTSPRGLLWVAFEESQPIEEGLRLIKESPKFQISFHFFSLFAFMTSLLGIGAAFVDVLGDFFRIELKKRIGLKRFWLCLLTFVLPALLGYLALDSILTFMRVVGGWVEAVFNGLIPVSLAVSARYIQKISKQPLLGGGKPVIIILAIATFFLFYLQGMQLIRGS